MIKVSHLCAENSMYSRSSLDFKIDKIHHIWPRSDGRRNDDEVDPYYMILLLYIVVLSGLFSQRK